MSIVLGAIILVSSEVARAQSCTVDETANLDQGMSRGTCSVRGWSQAQCQNIPGSKFKPDRGSGFTECFFSPSSVSTQPAGSPTGNTGNRAQGARSQTPNGSPIIRAGKYCEDDPADKSRKICWQEGSNGYCKKWRENAKGQILRADPSLPEDAGFSDTVISASIYTQRCPPGADQRYRDSMMGRKTAPAPTR